jgi:hypothetical protein
MRQEHWLVQFITLCTGGEPASQMKGIDQLREVVWELLIKGRAGDLEKDNFEDIRDADEEDDNASVEEK